MVAGQLPIKAARYGTHDRSGKQAGRARRVGYCLAARWAS